MAIVANPSVSALYEDALVYETGTAITSSGALSAYSGNKTGRSPLDKRVVKEPSSEKDVWWGPVNKPMSPEVSMLFVHVLPFDSIKQLRLCLSGPSALSPISSQSRTPPMLLQEAALWEGQRHFRPSGLGPNSPRNALHLVCMWMNGT